MPEEGRNKVEVEATGRTVEGKTFNQPYPLEEDIQRPPGIEIGQEPYYLTEADYLRLKHSPTTVGWATALVIASLGFGLSLIGKFVSQLFNPKDAQFATWEFVALGIGLFAAFVLYVTSKFLPNEHKGLLTDIEHHFRRAPRIRRPLKEKK